MSDTQIHSIVESEFGVRLPRTYLRFLRNYPIVLTQPVIKSRPDLGAHCDASALRDTEALLELNREFRGFWPKMEFNEKHRPFPRNRFLIGDVDGDLLAVNTRSFALVRVFIYKHEHGWWLPYAFSMWHFTWRIARNTIE